MSGRTRCYGSEGVKGEPLCDGPDVRHVLVETGPKGDRFETEWCLECRRVAEEGGWRVTTQPPADVRAYARSFGWEVTTTGGGCTALRHPDPSGVGEWLLTAEYGAEVPLSFGPCLLGLYDGAGVEMGTWWHRTVQGAIGTVAAVVTRDAERGDAMDVTGISEVARQHGGDVAGSCEQCGEGLPVPGRFCSTACEWESMTPAERAVATRDMLADALYDEGR